MSSTRGRLSEPLLTQRQVWFRGQRGRKPLVLHLRAPGLAGQLVGALGARRRRCPSGRRARPGAAPCRPERSDVDPTGQVREALPICNPRGSPAHDERPDEACAGRSSTRQSRPGNASRDERRPAVTGRAKNSKRPLRVGDPHRGACASRRTRPGLRRAARVASGARTRLLTPCSRHATDRPSASSSSPPRSTRPTTSPPSSAPDPTAISTAPLGTRRSGHRDLPAPPRHRPRPCHQRTGRVALDIGRDVAGTFASESSGYPDVAVHGARARFGFGHAGRLGEYGSKHKSVQERQPHRGRRHRLQGARVPARQAREGRGVRAHQAAPRRRRGRDRQDVPRRREVPGRAHRVAQDAVPLRRRHRRALHGLAVLRPAHAPPGGRRRRAALDPAQ